MTRTIDVQAHVATDTYWSELEALAQERPPIRGILGSLRSLDPERRLRRVDDDRIATMDEAGVDVQVLSLQPPAVDFPPRARAAELAATYNNELLVAAQRYPGRFLVLCTLPFPHAEECVTELERLAANPLVRGALINTHTDAFTLDEERFEPIYAKLAELKMPAVLHPDAYIAPPFMQHGLVAVLGMMMSSSLAGLRLILGGLLDRQPDLDLVIPHLGGTIPYLVQRALDLVQPTTEHDLLHHLRNRVWLDSNSYWPPALRCAVDTVGGDRIMMGSDYPLRRTLDVAVRDITESTLDGDTQAAILGRTASRWFGEVPLRDTPSAAQP
jgi:aminocarboxymuconate-semialdehyde decarboxylase